MATEPRPESLPLADVQCLSELGEWSAADGASGPAYLASETRAALNSESESSETAGCSSSRSFIASARAIVSGEECSFSTKPRSA